MLPAAAMARFACNTVWLERIMWHQVVGHQVQPRQPGTVGMQACACMWYQPIDGETMDRPFRIQYMPFKLTR